MTEPMPFDEGLFPGLTPIPPVAPEVVPEGARRRARQYALLLAGYHPLALVVRHLKLHPDRADPTDRSAPGLRCKHCAHAIVQGGTAGRYLKCELYNSRGPGTDLRLWWPACVMFTAIKGDQ